MRLLRLHVERFGALADRTFELDGRAFVLEGPNEAGKSSFHAAVETLFYGFEPSTREANKYATWTTTTGVQHTTLRIVGLVELAGGRRLQVERRLGSRGQLRVAEEGAELDGPWQGNLALEELQAIPRPLFRAVYSLTANEVSEPDDSDIQELIDDLLLGDRGLVGAHSVRELRTAVAEERTAQWRPQRRGETRESRAAARRLELGKELREASDAERARSEAEAELSLVQQQIRRLEDEHQAVVRELDDGEILGELARLERAEAELEHVDLSVLEGEHIAPADLARRLESAGRALQEPRARLARPALEASARHRALVERAEHVRHLDADAVRDENDAAEVRRLEQEAREASARARAFVDGFVHAEAAAAPLDALRAGAIAWSEEVATARADLEARRRVWWPAVVALFLGASLAGASLGALLPPLAGGAGLLLLVACGLALLLRRPREARRLREVEQPTEELATLAEEAGLVPTATSTPDVLLEAVGALDEARSQRALASEAQRAAGVVRARRQERRARWRELAEVVRVDAPEDALPKVLGEQLAGAREALARAEADATERAEVGRSLARLETEHAELARRHEALLAGLQRARPETLDPDAAWAELADLARERVTLEGERRQLARKPRFAELEEDPRRSPDADAQPFWTDELQEARAARLAALRAELDERKRLAGELTERARQLPPGDAAGLASELREVEAEIAAARRAHDRLALIERALVLGERRFRADHQPDVLRAASEHLGRITGGRYDRIDYPDPESPTLHVRSAELDELVPVGPPLSRGVREQVHLCLRLGTLEHLDRGREALPLVLDEALVHWDPPRRRALYDVLRPLTERRQVVLLTCQPELATEARQLLGARHVSLGDRSVSESRTPDDALRG